LRPRRGFGHPGAKSVAYLGQRMPAVGWASDAGTIEFLWTSISTQAWLGLRQGRFARWRNGGRGTRVARRVPRAPMSLGRSRPPRSASRRRLIVGLSFRILSGPVPKASHGIGTLARICAAPRATSLVIRGRSARAPIIGRIITPRIIIPGLVATMVRRAISLLRPLLRSSIGRSLFCTGLGDQCLGRGRG
jgi:hypothetical protein